MKQVSRIILVLVLVLMVGTAFAAPSNRAQIENLPECPAYPELTVHNDGQVVTVNLSAPLKDKKISGVANWQWIPAEMAEDGLSGTISLEGLKCSLGAGTWTSHWNGFWDGSYYEGELPATFVYKQVEDNWIKDGVYGGVQLWANHPKTVVRRDTFVEAYEPIYNEKGQMVLDKQGHRPENDVYTECRAWGTCAGYYWMGFAYNGQLEDGSDVKYGQNGKLVRIEKNIADGTSYLGGAKTTGVKLTWKVLYNTPYLASIEETYEDGTGLNAYFGFSGKLIGLVEVK